MLNASKDDDEYLCREKLVQNDVRSVFTIAGLSTFHRTSLLAFIFAGTAIGEM